MSKNPRDQPAEDPEDRGDRWLLNGIIWFVSALFIAGSISQGYLPGVGLGVVLAIWRVMATPEITNYFALKINWKGRRQSIKVQQSPGAQAVAVQGDNPQVTIEQNPSQTAQQLAELVYSPLLTEAKSWSNPMTLNCRMWKELQEKVPHLTRLVKTDIASLFGQAERLSLRITALNFSLQELEIKACLEAREKLGLTQSRPGQGSVCFRVFKTNLPPPLCPVYVNWLWVSGKRLLPYVQDFVDEKYPGIDWDLDLQIDGFTVGDKSKAIQFADEVFAYYEKQPVARQQKEKYDEMRDLGLKAQSRIDEELDKLVHLKI